MTQIFQDTRAVPVTVVKAGPCFVAQIKNAGARRVRGRPARVRRAAPQRRHEAHAGPLRRERRAARAPRGGAAHRRRRQLLAGPGAEGRRLRRSASAPTSSGVSKGKGFAGVMKRHGFGGLELEPRHAAQAPLARARSARAPRPAASSRACGWPGHMGNARTTILNLEIVGVDPERNVLLIRGAVPGPNGGLVMVRSAVKAADAEVAPDGLGRRPRRLREEVGHARPARRRSSRPRSACP